MTEAENVVGSFGTSHTEPVSFVFVFAYITAELS